MIGVVACLTNLLLAVLVSKNVDLYVPTSMAEQLGSFEAKVSWFVVSSDTLLWTVPLVVLLLLPLLPSNGRAFI